MPLPPRRNLQSRGSDPASGRRSNVVIVEDALKLVARLVGEYAAAHDHERKAPSPIRKREHEFGRVHVAIDVVKVVRDACVRQVLPQAVGQPAPVRSVHLNLAGHLSFRSITTLIACVDESSNVYADTSFPDSGNKSGGSRSVHGTGMRRHTHSA